LRAPATSGVRVKLESAPVPQPFTEIAIVQAKGYGTHADLEHVVSALRSECARLGGDLLARVRVDQGSASASGVGVCGFDGSPP
jgi:hypothetical protein